jgi:hypothetical protein|uniref:Uncharacterized protein n=1 Tax=Attheya septentrionalis TaxID=420275 RepID=A0A7S2XLR5_9STRA|mmetsp:Transcript_12284/g.22290  ORF Transcript_12284/g.22290 Transcript_12284/m.22290 type:complete len:164 (+) Transcript_12284:97-588(+)
MWTYLTKEKLVYMAFTVDALNTFVSFPLFVIKGPKWVLSSILSAKDKEDDDKILEDVDRKSFQNIWDLFMVCYEGYFGFTVSTLICIYKAPETIPIFAYSLFGLYLYKLKYLWSKYSTLANMKDDDKYKKQTKSKLDSVMFFFLPCYGGYCAMHLLQLFRDLE